MIFLIKMSFAINCPKKFKYRNKDKFSDESPGYQSKITVKTYSRGDNTYLDVKIKVSVIRNNLDLTEPAYQDTIINTIHKFDEVYREKYTSTIIKSIYVKYVNVRDEIMDGIPDEII